MEVGSDRGAEVLDELGAPDGRRRTTSTRRRPRSPRRPPAGWAGTLDTAGLKDLLYARADSPIWDDVADALPRLRQLHRGLPDLLLHRRRGRHRPHRRRRGPHPGVGLLLRRRLLLPPRRHRARVDARPLPAVDDPQAGRRGSTSSACPAAWAAAGASPGARPAIDITEEAAALRAEARRRSRRRETDHDRRIAELPSRAPVLRRARRRLARAGVAGCAGNVHFSAGRATSSARASRPTRFYVIRHGRVAIEVADPPTGPRVIDTVGDGDVVGWSWLVPPYRWIFDARATDDVDADRLRRRLPARQVRATTRASATRCSSAWSRVMSAGCTRPGSACSTSTDADRDRCDRARPTAASSSARRGDGAAPVRRRRDTGGTRATPSPWSWRRRRRAARPSPPGSSRCCRRFGVGEVPISISGDPAHARACCSTPSATSAPSPAPWRTRSRGRRSGCAARSARLGGGRRRAAATW